MSDNFLHPLSSIFYIIDKDYRSLHPEVEDALNDSSLDLADALEMALRNKVGALFCTNIIDICKNNRFNKVKSILEEEEILLVKLKKTLRFLDKTFRESDIPYLIVKTYKGMSFATRDVDIAVNRDDMEKACRLFDNMGADITGGRFIKKIMWLGLASPGYKPENMLDIDIYDTFPWPELPTMDDEFLWRNPRKVDISGVECLVPNKEADFVSIISSPLYTDREITILDFLYLRTLIKEGIDFDMMKDEISRYGWEKGFFEIVSMIKKLEDSIYVKGNLTGISFPLKIPFSLVLRSIPGPFYHKFKNRPSSFFKTVFHLGFHVFFGNFYRFILEKSDR